jgi:nodulation protein E
MARQRIVITGIGGVCALGTSAPEIWESMKAGRLGVSQIENAPIHDLKNRLGAEIKQLPDHGLDRKRLITMDRFSLLAIIAAKEAIQQSGVVVDASNERRIGVAMGTGIFGGDSCEENYRALLVEGKPRANVFTVPRIMPSAPTGQVSMQFGLKGPAFGVTSACASSNHAFSAAADQLRLGRADVMVAGGTDAPLFYGVLKAWEALRAMAREACRPFSADRDGLVIGEGAGVAVMETLEHAQARGATILAEFAGAGMSADAADIVAPTVDGPSSALQRCLEDGGIAIEDVDYINAHGTATKANDAIETQAIRRVFRQHADKLSVSSTKSMHGHCMGASGAVEMIACLGALRDHIVPPTIGYRMEDPECDLDVTPNVAKARNVRVALSNAFAFGGTNAVVAFKAI